MTQAILGVTFMFRHGKLHILVVQTTTLFSLIYLQTLTRTGTCRRSNFPCQNMTVTPKIAPRVHFYYTRVFNGRRAVSKRKQTRENVSGLCLNANGCITFLKTFRISFFVFEIKFSFVWYVNNTTSYVTMHNEFRNYHYYTSVIYGLIFISIA